MTERKKNESNKIVPIGRRDVLKIAGAGGAIGTYGTGQAAGKGSDQYIVGIEPGRAAEARRQADEVIKTLNFGDIGQAVVGRWTENALRGLERNPNVRYIEKDLPLELDGHDPSVLDWGRDRIDVDKAHEAGFYGRTDIGTPIRVAIIDSGIDSRHPYLIDNLDHDLHHAPATCDSDDCPEEWHDTDGHGTGVAGIVAASHNDFHTSPDGHGAYTLDSEWDRAPIGVAPEATLHAVKVFDGDGEGFSSDLADGLEWCADNNIDVANMSLGSSHSQTVEDAMQYARDHDVILVSSAGNEEGGDVTFPGGYPQDIAVSGVTELDEFSTHSSKGPEVDIAGPTRPAVADIPDVQDGRPNRTTWLGTGGNAGAAVLGRMGGTSAAAPHVAGVAALLLANGTHPNNVQDVLEDTAEDLGLDEEEQGAGLVDAANSLGLDSSHDLLRVATSPADEISFTEARLNGQLTHLVGSDTAKVFFEYREEGATIWQMTDEEDLSALISPILDNFESFETSLTDLEPATTYEYRAVARVEEPAKGWASSERGEDSTFQTEAKDPPTAAFSYDPAVPNPGEEVTFTSEATDPEDHELIYEWDLGDGTFEVLGETVTITYDDPGNVTIRHRVTDEFGQLDVIQKNIRVNAPPEATFTYEPENPNEGDEITFDASDSNDPDGEIDEYQWNFGDETIETTSNPIIEYSYGPAGEGNHGEFEVTLTVTDDDDATDEVSETINVNAVPIAKEFSVDPILPNEGDEITFDASDSNDPDGEIDEYQWNFGDETSETTSNPIIEYSYGPAGEDNFDTFEVSLRVTDNAGASHDVISVHKQDVRVNAYPVAEPFDILVGGEPMDPMTNPVVRDEPVVVDASDSFDPDPEPHGGIAEYAWDFGDGGTVTTSDPTIEHTFDEGGEKTVGLTLTDNDGASHEEISVHEETFTVNILVTIEIKPNEDNDINPRGRGNIPIAVHHTADFNSPVELNPGSVRFGKPATINEGDGATPAHEGGHIDDVTDNGDDDWHCHFPVRDTGFERGDVEGKLVGETTDGVPVFGFDDVNTVGGGRP